MSFKIPSSQGSNYGGAAGAGEREAEPPIRNESPPPDLKLITVGGGCPLVLLGRRDRRPNFFLQTTPRLKVSFEPCLILPVCLILAAQIILSLKSLVVVITSY